MGSENFTSFKNLMGNTNSSMMQDVFANFSVITLATETFVNNMNICKSMATLYPNGTMTKEQNEYALFLIFQVFMPILCVIGITGNSLCAIVLFHSRDKNAFSTYLKALTMSDIFLLFNGLLQFISKVLSSYLKESASLIASVTQLIISFGIGHFVWSLSSLLITVMAVERFVSVAFPFKIKVFVLEKHPRRVIAILFLIQVILRTPTVIWTEIKQYTDCATNNTMYHLEYREWSRDIVLRRGFNYLLVVCDMLIPILTVLSMNTALLVCLKRRPKLTAAASKKGKATGNVEQNKITVTLMILSVFYLISVIPYMTTYILVTLRPEFTLRSKEYYLYSVIINANILIVAFNAANDFVIYILSSNRFRAQFKTKYFCWRKKLERRGSSVRAMETQASTCL